MVGLPKEMTAEEAAAELACEELRQKWAEEEHRRELLYIRTQQERELKMQMLRSRAQSRACVDLTTDSNDEGDAKIKTELHNDHEFGSGSAYQSTPPALQALQTPAPSRASTRSMPRVGEQMSVPAANTVRQENDSFRPGNNFAGFNNKFADFTGPYPEQLPTIINDPNGIPGRDYIELRCGECGANFGRNQTFIKGAWGFYAHLRSIHGKKYPKGTLPSAAQLVEMCAYRAVSRSEVESLRRQKSKIKLVLSPGAEADHPSKRKRKKDEAQGNTTKVSRKAAKSTHRDSRAKSTLHEKAQEMVPTNERRQRGMRRKRRVVDSGSDDSEDADARPAESPEQSQPTHLSRRSDLRCWRRSPPPRALRQESNELQEQYADERPNGEWTGQSMFQEESLPFGAEQNGKHPEDTAAELEESTGADYP